MADKTYQLDFVMSDGTTQSVQFTVPQGEKGNDGVSPVVSTSKSGKITAITITDANGSHSATINDGENGADGQDGYTPQKGIDYHDGEDGHDGKSAYEYAQDGGYTGTEEVFAAKLAEEAPKVFYVTVSADMTTADKTNAEIYEAYRGGRPVCCICTSIDGLMMQPMAIMETMSMFVAFMGNEVLGVIIENDEISGQSITLSTEDDIPDTLPNPYNIYLYKGDKSIRYNGDRSTECYVPVITLNKTGNTATITVQDEGEEQSIVIVEGSGSVDSESIPDYWQTALDEGVEAINAAVETAGRNKSAFLWYSDVHWGWNFGMSPMLLKYLSQHTGINKVNFGGDFANAYEYPDTGKTDEDWIDLMREWRLAISDLPNHHSVVGNHDTNGSIPYLASLNRVYGFLMAPEETPNIVRGSDFTYYIDEPNEKTRYMYLPTGRYAVSDDETKFVVDALTNAPDGWHIVAISHIWFLYDDSSTPTVGSVPSYCQNLLNLFDAYNAKSSGSVTMNSTAISYDFTNAGGKVEFCIGGHTHVDMDFTSDGGVPVILTETDSRYVRGDSVCTEGTTDEASVNGVIADYDNNKISIIRIGRGESREVEIGNTSGGNASTYTNQLPIATDTDGSIYNAVGYKESTRLSVSSGSFTEKTETGWCTSGLIPAVDGDVIRLKNCICTISTTAATHRGYIYGADANGAYNGQQACVKALASDFNAVFDSDGDNLIQFTVPSWMGDTYIRITAQEFTNESIITVNEEII